VRSRLSEEDANQIVLALDRAAVVATKSSAPGAEQHGYAIEVAASEVARALRVLEAQRLPQAVQPGVQALYDEPGLLATPAEERARWAAATAGELSRSLARMPGVRNARVHLALPGALDRLDGEPPPITAAVLIERRLGAAAIADEPVQKLVAAAVTGLEPYRVAVIQVTPAAQEPSAPVWARVGPFVVARDSAGWLRVVLAGALALHLMMALALIALFRRGRQTTREGVGTRARSD
jgi:type III secretion protein J